jgi:hypothetical protein
MAGSAMTTFSIPKKKFVMPVVSPDVLEIPGVAEFMAFTQQKIDETNLLIDQARAQQREIARLKKNQRRAAGRKAR